jgi:predicted aspartyl protease
MGMTDVRLKVRNYKDPKKVYEGKFLVDSGATYSIVPAKELKRLGIEPHDMAEFSLADASKTIRRKIGHALFEYNGKQGPAPVVFGEKDDSQLLGVMTLEALGLVLDPLKRKLYKAKLRM